MPPQPAPTPRRGSWPLYFLVFIVTAAAAAGVTALLANIRERKAEGDRHYLALTDLTEESVDPELWRINFPRQYDSYKRTTDVERTRYGGSESVSLLKEDPNLLRMFAGYPFAVEYNAARGHAYMLSDQDATRRVKQFKQTGACLHCHASVMPVYRKLGDGDVEKGFKEFCAMPLDKARGMVQHPVACLDCHEPKTVSLRVTRPGFLHGIRDLAASDQPVPHMPSIAQWRKDHPSKESREKTPYNPNSHASRQEMRSFVCGQCHVEYYFKGADREVTYPWADGLLVEQMEGYYDRIGFKDWVHRDSGAPMLKAQHPEFELWSQGTHARAGVSCADCHMPYERQGAVKVSDHHVRSPLLNISKACQTCHRVSEAELLGRAETIQTRHKGLKDRAEGAVVDLIDAIKAGKERGVPEDRLDAARKLHRKAQWRADFVAAENSMGFHAPHEAARILGEAIDYARQGQVIMVGEGKK